MKPLLVPLAMLLAEGCMPSVEPIQIPRAEGAVCSSDKTLLDQLNGSSDFFADWIAENIEDGLEPGIELSIPRVNFDLPDTLDYLVPDDLASIGLISYPYNPESVNGFSAFLVTRNQENQSYYYDPVDASVCDDLSFAYQADDPKFTVTGKCELLDDELTCKGTFYEDCAINPKSPLGPYDCNALANYEDVSVDKFALNMD